MVAGIAGALIAREQPGVRQRRRRQWRPMAGRELAEQGTLAGIPGIGRIETELGLVAAPVLDARSSS